MCIIGDCLTSRNIHHMQSSVMCGVVFFWVLLLHTLNQIDNRLLEVPLQELVLFIEITT